MRSQALRAVFLCMLLFAASSLLAENEKHVYSGKPKFAYGFSSHMVLQRDTETNIWGFANKGTTVTISIGPQTITGKADPYGKWLVKLAPMEAGGPYALQLQSDQTVIKLEDVLIGDVWICSGQSNMRYGLSRKTGKGENDPYIYADELAEIRKQSSFPIRHVMDNNDELSWLQVTYENAVDSEKNPPGVTAVGYFFAKHLRKNLGNVPIGIIQTGAGGEAIRHFIPKDVQWADPDLRKVWDSKSAKGPTYWATLLAENPIEKLIKHEAIVKAWQDGESSSETCPSYVSGYPGYLFLKFMPMLKNLKFKGMVWYQGESDVGRAEAYPHHLEVLIDFYRGYFDFPKMPFIVVMLPPWKNSRYPLFTYGQLSLADRKEGVAVAYAPEAGDPEDIHPPKKDIIGQRAALSALAVAYGKDVAYLGPRYRTCTKENGGNIITVVFKDTAGGLKLADGEAVLTGFELAGADGTFTDAEAKLPKDKDSVEIVIPGGLMREKLIRIQYNWKPYYVPVLYGQNGLPAVSFSSEVHLN